MELRAFIKEYSGCEFLFGGNCDSFRVFKTIVSWVLLLALLSPKISDERRKAAAQMKVVCDDDVDGMTE